jgi:uncharacterized RDD family membrane protein YckC
MARLDTLALIETPEGIALRLRAAGVAPRAAAWAIDLLVRLVVLWVLSIALAFMGKAGVGPLLIAMFLIYWFYPVVFEVLRDGQTIGKRALGIRVVHANGTPVGWQASFVRNLLRTVDTLPIGYVLGMIASFIDPSSRRLGDMVAGTLVVYTEPALRHVIAPNVPTVHPPVSLTSEDKAAIVAFAERAGLLTPERQLELAAIAAPLTQAEGATAVQRLLGMAAAILGRH